MQSMKLTKQEKCIFFLLLILGVSVRVYRFGSAPPGLNQDEAFAAYDAWALLHYGTDSSLHRFPAYLTAWGSGMNALESYLMIPGLALFGVKAWVIRLPQLVLALLALPASFSVGRRLGSNRGGLCTLAVLALCPWHVLLSRWALESNMAPNLLLLGLCFFLKGREDGRFLPVSALCYGLALYAYSAIWPVMPLLLGLMLWYTRPKADRWLLGSGVILAVLALPLVGFLAVNYGLIGEFSLGPFSVPKLVQMRAGEISLSHVPDNLKTMLRILLTQSDGLKWNSAGDFGLFYPVALPFGLLGIFALVRRTVLSLRERRFDAACPLLVWLAAGTVLAALISVNVNRMNFLLMPIALTVALGAETALRLLGRYARITAPLLLAGFLIFFGFFARFYFTDYSASLNGEFTAGWDDALDAALSHEGTIYVTRALHYPKLLLRSETSPEEFNATVEYEYYPAQYLSPRRFGRFVYVDDAAPPFEPDGVYVLWNGSPTERFEEAGFTIERYGCFEVLYP